MYNINVEDIHILIVISEFYKIRVYEIQIHHRVNLHYT